MDNYKSLLMEAISKKDLVSKPAKIKRAGKLKEDLLPDEVYNTLVRKSKKTYTVGVYSTLPGPGWHYEINTEYGVYAKVPDDEGFIAHWFLQGLPQESEEKMENMAHYLIDEYDCREVSLDEYKRIVNGKNESLKINRSKLLKESVTESDIAYAVEWAKTAYKKSKIDLDNKKIVIPLSGIPKGESFEEIEDEIMSEGYIGHKLEEMGFNVSLSLGDFEYTTNGEFNPRSMIKYKGHKSYLRNRVIMTVTWDDINESLTEDTVKTSDGKWTNKGKEGTHGKFKTKKAADAQRKAMFVNGYHESLEDTKGKEMTALVRLPSGNLKVMHDDWFKNQKDFAEELRANGFKVLNIWYGYKSDAEADEWEMLHRKTNESLYGSKSLKEAHLGPYKYRYETHWINGRDVLLGANKTRDGAENIAYNQIEDILGNPWENDRNKYKIIDSLYIYDSENDDDDIMSMELEDYIDSILSELSSRIELKKESLTERYADDAVVLTAPLRKKLNKICYKYSGFHSPGEIAPMWKELYDLGIEVLIQGYPTNTAPGAKSWTVPFKLNGETVENSMFVYSVYEGSEGLKNDYNMYFS